EAPVGGFDLLAGERFGDEDQSRGAYRVGPCVEMQHGMHKMLDGMQDSRLLRTCYRQQAFDAQDPVTMAIQQHRKPEGEDLPVKGPVDLDAARLDALAFRIVSMHEAARGHAE